MFDYFGNIDDISIYLDGNNLISFFLIAVSCFLVVLLLTFNSDDSVLEPRTIYTHNPLKLFVLQILIEIVVLPSPLFQLVYDPSGAV